jgi:histidinol dehydrogenase
VVSTGLDGNTAIAITKTHARYVVDAQAVSAAICHCEGTTFTIDDAAESLAVFFASNQLATINGLLAKAGIDPVQQFKWPIGSLPHANLQTHLDHVLLAVVAQVALVIDALITTFEGRLRRWGRQHKPQDQNACQNSSHGGPPVNHMPRVWPSFRGAATSPLLFGDARRKRLHMKKAVNVHRLGNMSPVQRQALLRRTETDLSDFIDKVRPIMAHVRTDGDTALAHFAKHFDGVTIRADDIAATEADFASAEKTLGADMHAALRFAADSVTTFHKAQMPAPDWMIEVRPGVHAGDRTTAIPSVACYVPRGKGAFPSTVLMTAIPATVAGVEDICIVTPPGPDGKIDDATLVAARLAGVSKVYKAGGAQAIAAVAFGTQTINPVRKIVGPGSPWVAAAKRLVADIVDVGTPAGPSESIVLADATSSGKLAALDLLIEAEHGPDSSAYLVTWDEMVAQEAIATLDEYVNHLSAQRADFVSEVLSGPLGGIILARDEDEAIGFINDYAPEHLQILSKEPGRYLDKVKHAGEILLGEFAPSTLANFVVGPSHVLPTGGWARTGSALSVHDFLKRTSIVKIMKEGYAALAPHAKTFARYEGFDAHGHAVGELRKPFLGN